MDPIHSKRLLADLPDGSKSFYLSLISFAALSFAVLWVGLWISGFQPLANFFAFMVAATTVVPIPTPPAVLYMGTLYPALSVAVVGGAASAIGCLLDYIIIGRASDTRYFSKYRDSPLLIKSKDYFETNGFLTLMFFALTPFPFEPVKILAILTRYNVKLYIIAISFSRGLRYYILAGVGVFLTLTQIILITAAFIVVSLIQWKRKSH